MLQGQPGLEQVDGSHLPRSTHLTVTPVTTGVLEPLERAMREAADEVRGHRPSGSGDHRGAPDPRGLAESARSGGELDLTAVLALIEVLPREQSAGLLTEFLAAFTEPR